jgi:hypothetical protein
MTRSHVLLHCPNDKIKAAREEACLLANPRWEKRLLELPGVGRVMDDGADEEETRDSMVYGGFGQGPLS